MTIKKLYKIIQKRKNVKPENSYVSSLLKKENDAILQKIGEESTEVIIAAKNNLKKEIIYETSDLLFMLIVYLVKSNITLEEIYDELEKRNKKA